MSMTDTIKNLVEDVSAEEEQVQEEELTSSEVSEDEVLALAESEVSEEAEEDVDVTEAKAKEDSHDEEDEEDDEVEESAPKFEMPKTKAGVINAAVEMLKKARKHEAQQLFAKMVAMDESEDDGSVKKAIGAVKPEKDKSIKAKSSDASPKQEDVDWDEDLDILVAEEATLSDGFRDKAGTIFQAAYTSKVSGEIDRLESEYAQNLETEVADIQSGLVEKVDSYLNYVVGNWMTENEVAIQQGLKTEIAEEFMTSLQSVFKEHYIEVPEGKADLIDDLADQVTELEDQLNKSTEDNIRLTEATQQLQRAEIVRKQSSGLAATDAEKLSTLVADIDFEDEETFQTKVQTVRESYFKEEGSQPVDEADALVGEDSGTEVPTSDTMSAYTQAITKHNQ